MGKNRAAKAAGMHSITQYTTCDNLRSGSRGSSRRLLAWILRFKQLRSLVLHLTNPQWGWWGGVSTQHDIVTVFRDHLEGASENPGDPDPERLVEYLAGVCLPLLGETVVQALEAGLTLEEVEVVINSLPLVRSPGSDSFMAEFYQTFATALALQLLALYKEGLTADILPDSMQEGLIAMIRKSGIASSDPASYRPITMIDLNVKSLRRDLPLR
ncbi:hypothetical protein NDU88_002096 [Pleurodeles waltl]|uniref:Uncharacterized protein n=1 Tax=Pleurodeles waltl TaxID=8319 RepID=A0AAV7W1E5_PLEWA|nr:hypothetical protein NDU88_002096 [Pleurodeles waltl]